MDKIKLITQKIKILKALDRDYQIFEASHHRYNFNSPLTVGELERFEEFFRIILPKDYRYFLLNIGNGGAGPYYGIMSLEASINLLAGVDFDEPDGIRDDYFLREFPHRLKWNYKEICEYLGDEEGAIHAEIINEHLNQNYPNIDDDRYTQGSIPICDYGCGIYYLLVVSGDERGNIWVDSRADDAGIYPCLSNGKKLDFYEWYLQWLDQSIASLRAQP